MIKNKTTSAASAVALRLGPRAALLVLLTGFFLATWPTQARISTESISLFADARRATPKNVFNLGETVWAMSTGARLGVSNEQRRFQWVAPDGTIARQSPMTTAGQLDSYRLPPSAQVGTWLVKMVDPSNNGIAAATFVVRNPQSDKAAVDLIIGLSGPLQASAGKQLTYTLHVANHGPDEAQSVRFVAEVASGATFRSLTEARGWTCTKPAASEAGLLTCVTDSMASGATAQFTINYQIDENAPGELTINHFADVLSQTTELHEPDNRAVATTTVIAEPCILDCSDDLNAVSEPGKGGAVINYAAPSVSSNNGNASIQVDCNPPSGSFFPAGVTNVVCSSLAGGACNFKVTVTGAVAITLAGAEQMVMEQGADFADPGATWQNSSGKIFPATVSGKVDVRTPGIYTITYTATDGAYTATATRQVKVIDTTPPHITCPANIITDLPLNATAKEMSVRYAPTASDGDARPVIITTPASGAFFPIGVTPVEATAVDAAGNKHSCSFTVSVRYRFTNLFSPKDKPAEWHTAQAGSDLPIRFSLSGNKGFNIFAPSYPVTTEMSCNAAERAEATTPVATKQSNFGYDPSIDQYTYVWTTQAGWAGTCRQLIIKLSDDSEYRFNFKFR